MVFRRSFVLVLVFVMCCDIFSTPTTEALPLDVPTSTSRPHSHFGYQNVLQTAPLKLKPTPESLTQAQTQLEESGEDFQTEQTPLLPEWSSEDISGEFDEISTEHVEDEELRLALCPDTTKDFRYDNETKRCYQLGAKAHCGKNMAFQDDGINAVFGFCDCNNASMVPLVFHPKSRACFRIYDQAYCLKGEWLTFSRDLEPVCSPRTCKKSKNKSHVSVLLNGDGPCVRLNSSSKFCESEEVVLFAPETVVPTCQRNASSAEMLPRVLAAPSGKCAPGSYRSMTGQCVSGWSWSL